MIVHPDIVDYLEKLAPIPDPVLEEMEQLGKARNFPIVGPLVGRLLAALVQFGHVHTVLECGSGFGYSAMWMALTLPENGKITCIEFDEQNIRQAKKFFERAELSHKVSFMRGDAVEIVSELSQTYDLILNDVNKEQYPNILPLLLKKLRVGGMLITDNVLWKGKVAHNNDDGLTSKIRQYNDMLIQEKSLWTSILPLRDGVALSIKLRV